jgi:hypothetical protein
LLRSIVIQSHNLCPDPLSTLLQLTFSLWHSEDRASWYFLIIKANNLHYFSYLSDKVLYMLQTGPLSIIRSISTLYTRNRYVFVMLVLLESASSANCHNALDWPLTTPATRPLLNILILSLLDGHNQQLRPYTVKRHLSVPLSHPWIDQPKIIWRRVKTKRRKQASYRVPLRPFVNATLPT